MGKVLVRAKTNVLSVEERFKTTGAYKDPKTNEAVFERESLGWFIRITESSAIGVGPDKPDIQSGDEIIITLEKP